MSLSAKKLLVTAMIPFALAACGEDPTANDHVSAHVYRTVEEGGPTVCEQAGLRVRFWCRTVRNRE